jgi:hypothetical protein
LVLYRTSAGPGIVAARRSQGQSQHVDNPGDRVKFGDASRRKLARVGTTDRDPVQIRERFMRGVGVRKEVKAG